MINGKSVLSALVLLACHTVVASAQSAIRDADQEARNAYQEHCSINSANNVAFTWVPCSFPPLPTGKRLAMREVSVNCSYNGSRLLGGSITYGLSTQPYADQTEFRGLQSYGDGSHFLTLPLYAHSDVTPNVNVYLNPNTSGWTTCKVSIRGYLVSKQ